jgi:hypothetical protein
MALQQLIRVIASIAAIGVAIAAPAHAQTSLTDRLHVGDRIRATIGPIRFDATIRSLQTDSVQIAASGKLQTLPAMYLKDVERAGPSKGHAASGAIIGGVTGAAFGAFIGAALSCIFTCEKEGLGAIEGAAAGGVSLALVGALVGSVIRTTTWDQIGQ